MSSFPPADIKKLEDKTFTMWLSLLELLSGFSLFKEFMADNALPHLFYEVDRWIHGEVVMPNPPSGHVNACGHVVNGRYSESWRDKSNRKTDMVLRITRLLVKC